MAVQFPVYKSIAIEGYGLYPGLAEKPGLSHAFTPGLHLIAGVNGLGKTTLLLMLYHGLTGPAAIRNDDFSVPKPEWLRNIHADRFRKRVADGAKEAILHVEFSIGHHDFSIKRNLRDLSILSWSLNKTPQEITENLYNQSVSSAMNLTDFADVVLLLNMIVFMFEDHARLMWNQQIQRNVLRLLFLPPQSSRGLAEKGQAVSATNSAYRNLLYIVNRDRKAFAKAKAKLASGDAVSAEYSALVEAITGDAQKLESLVKHQLIADDDRIDARAALEQARFTYDEALREIEALKIARIAESFPSSNDAGHYVLTRLLGDRSCLACDSEGGPLIDKWLAAVGQGCCVVCGTFNETSDQVIPAFVVDAARLEKAEERLKVARVSLDTCEVDLSEAIAKFSLIQQDLNGVKTEKTARENRLREIAGSLPPTPYELKSLADRLSAEERTLEGLLVAQRQAEFEFSELFSAFEAAVKAQAEAIRKNFASRISNFLVEDAEITLETSRAPLGESGQSYPWPVFRLSMTSGAFESPAARRGANDVSMSQGEFIDLAFRLALAEAAAGESAVTLVFDAPEASLDALFMRRAGAFLARFTADNDQNRLIVTSNLTNADMIPALFGAYLPEQGDPDPIIIPRSERKSRIIDLLAIAAPTKAVQLVGDRYRNLLDRAVFPPNGSNGDGL